jgi:hypothetical protein
MTLRDRAIRAVLIAAAFATMATSAPPQDYLEVSGAGTVRAPGGRLVRVVLDSTSIAEADDIRIQFELQDADGVSAVTLTPVGVPLEPARLKGVVEYSLDELCLHRPQCVLEFRLDAEGQGLAGVVVNALLTREGDPSLCFPDDRDFTRPGTSTIEFHD